MPTKVEESEFISALEANDWSSSKTAKQLQISERAVSKRKARLIKCGRIVKRTTQYDKNGNVQAYSTIEKPYNESKNTILPDSTVIRQSTLTDGEGKVVNQWNIRVNDDIAAAQKAAMSAFTRELVVLPPRACHNGHFSRNLANHYVLSDVHVGLVVENLIKNEKWDLEFCTSLVVRCFEHMIATSPKTDTAIINILGDWFHIDSLLPLTPTSGNILVGAASADDMVETGITLMRKLIDHALITHKRVVVVIAEGNHDLYSSIWLRKMMKHLYSEETRIEFVDNTIPFYAYAHGNVFLGFHHGHVKGLTNEKDLALMFADMFPDLYGTTTKRYIHTGHLHHLVKKEVAGFELIQHSTLAAKDPHAGRGGYRSHRAAISTSYHRLFGDVNEIKVTPEMLLSEDGFDIIELNHGR